MVSHMKTTILIADALFRKAKKTAEERGISFRAVVEEALREYLGSRSKAGKRFELSKSHFTGKGLQQGVTLGDWNRISEFIYEGRGG